jgi:CRISPR-associated protein Csm3
MTIRMIGRVQLEADLHVLTGLHIGAGKDTLEIGGIDNPVIKHPHTQAPFVPGSSLKGKMRFLLEWAFGTIRQDGHPWGFDEKDSQQKFDLSDPVQRIFGTPAKRTVWDGGPTRLICRDALLNPNWRNDTLGSGWSLTEDKTEVVIDRIAGKAHDKVGPRQTERVPAGARFDTQFVFRLYDTDDGGERDRQCLAWFIQALDLLEQDALGGSGSRGYGRIKFVNLTLTGFGRRTHMLDNIFRSHVFSRTAPPEVLMAIVNEATTKPAQAAA